jgi:hypothetical protein
MEKKAREARREEDDGVDGDGHISKRLCASDTRGEKNMIIDDGVQSTMPE